MGDTRCVLGVWVRGAYSLGHPDTATFSEEVMPAFVALLQETRPCTLSKILPIKLQNC